MTGGTTAEKATLDHCVLLRWTLAHAVVEEGYGKLEW